jgi:hypothetical protein
MSRLLLIAALVLSGSAIAPAEAKDKFCPPGLAKKAVPCVPPGQAKKRLYEDHDGDHRHGDWHHGDRVRGDYVLIPRDEWDRWQLRDYRDGSTYLRVDDQILRVVRDTLTVIEAVRIIDRALN